MKLKKHHKWVIGGFSTIVIIYMVITAVLLNGIIVKQQINHNELSDRIDNLQADTQNKLNELTKDLMETKNSFMSLDKSLTSELNELKASTSSDFSGVIESAIKSVVTVRTDIGQGTGFIIKEDGYIVTNAHVLSGGRTVYILDYEQTEHITELVGYDLDWDIALLKIEGNYPKLELGNSDNIHVGEKVIAIGNPLGLQFSVSEGIISAVDRIGMNEISGYIQTDAALNPGNSGGPLINTAGEVIGINNFKVGSGESLGFALESNYIKQAVNSIFQEQFEQNLI
ncbi:MAG TPA: trypsin-like peptidase domain-containing protein [Candidatus Pacearchaeota archaeon]|nr:trypsin-like peptidase domain-containing protein [Candidatus Pacearchaeota archaeon]